MPEAKQWLEKMAAASDDATEAERLRQVAESPLVFPTPDDTARLHTYRELLTGDEAARWDATFRKVYMS